MIAWNNYIMKKYSYNIKKEITEIGVKLGIDSKKYKVLEDLNKEKEEK